MTWETNTEIPMDETTRANIVQSIGEAVYEATIYMMGGKLPDTRDRILLAIETGVKEAMLAHLRETDVAYDIPTLTDEDIAEALKEVGETK